MTLQGGPSAVVERVWRRHSPGERFARFALMLAIVASVVWSVRTIEVIPEFLGDAPQQMFDLLRRMWPVDVAHYPRAIHDALIETLHIATLGTVLSILMAGARRAARGPQHLPQRRAQHLRAADPGVVALGQLAGLGADLRGDVRPRRARRHDGDRIPVDRIRRQASRRSPRGDATRPIEALTAAGAPFNSRLSKGYLPQVAPAFWGIALFRWDINVRESAVLGLVGAGGIGVVLDDAMNFFHWDRVAMVLIAIFAVVMIAEIIVNAVRRRLI